MRSTSVLLLCFTAAIVTVATAAPAERDISEIPATIEPVGNYLPPTEAENVESEAANASIKEEAADDQEADATLLTANGYEYKTVHQLRYRNRRDVSHLNLGYLPPPPAAKVRSQPTSKYLPPAAATIAPSSTTSTTTTTTTTVAPPPPPLEKLSLEYLPPLQNEPLLIVADTEAPEVSTEAAESTTTEGAEATDAPNDATEAALLTLKEAPEETAVFTEDGYHYKRPQVIPDLSAMPAPKSISTLPLVREYLPPLEDGVVVAEGPGEETSVLADDGYHIRAIRRLRY